MGNLFKVRLTWIQKQIEIHFMISWHSLLDLIYKNSTGAGKPAFRKLHSLCGISKYYRTWRSSFHTTPWPFGMALNVYANLHITFPVYRHQHRQIPKRIEEFIIWSHRSRARAVESIDEVSDVEWFMNFSSVFRWSCTHRDPFLIMSSNWAQLRQTTTLKRKPRVLHEASVFHDRTLTILHNHSSFTSSNRNNSRAWFI